MLVLWHSSHRMGVFLTLCLSLKLSLDELWDVVGRQGETFSNRVLHCASSLHGTKQYRQHPQRPHSSMLNTLALPTIFITHSAADLNQV